LKSSIKLKRILLTLFLGIGLIGVSIAGSCPDGSDPVKSISADGTYFVYNCGNNSDNVSKSNNSATTKEKTSTNKRTFAESPEIKSHSADLDITNHEVVFSPGVLNELLNRVVSKLDYDFSKHKLANNIKDLSCVFKLERVFYGDSELGTLEGWNLAEGTITIKESDVEFSGRSSWNMGGLSTDPSYLRDEVNIKLTKDGYFVGKMAYFTHTVKQGEVPREPLYVTLTKHKRSKPINLKSIRNSAELWIDVEDWQGGVMFVSNCK